MISHARERERDVKQKLSIEGWTLSDTQNTKHALSTVFLLYVDRNFRMALISVFIS